MCIQISTKTSMHDYITTRFNYDKEELISAREANNHLTCTAAFEGEDLGTWGELQIEYLNFKKREDDERSQGKFSRENVSPDPVSITMIKKDPKDKKTWLFDVSKIVWWHMPALYADYGGLCRHFYDQIQGLTGARELSQYNCDLNKNWKSLEFRWCPRFEDKADPNDDKYEQWLMVLMTMSDCLKYMKLKASKPNFKDCREVLKKLKEEKAKKDGGLITGAGKIHNRSIIQEDFLTSMTELENMRKEGEESPQKRRRLMLQNKSDMAVLRLGTTMIRSFYDRENSSM